MLPLLILGGSLAALGLGTGIAAAVEKGKAADKMEEQAELNQQLYNKQADFKKNVWEDFMRPEELKQQKFERDAIEAQFADSGVITTGSTMLALDFVRKQQQLSLLAKDKQVEHDVAITRLQGDLAYQQGLMQARATRTDAIFSGINSGIGAANTAVSMYGASSVGGKNGASSVGGKKSTDNKTGIGAANTAVSMSGASSVGGKKSTDNNS